MSVVIEKDLFGNPCVETSARFVNNCRIELKRIWDFNGPLACVIGHNPSTAGGTTEDRTTMWWMEWFSAFGFGGYVAVNLYPFRSPKPADCYQIVDRINAGNDWGARDILHFTNLPEVVRYAKEAAQVFVCWGAIARDQGWIEHVVEEVQSGEAPWPDLWCWGTNADGSPKHPMARGKHRIAQLQQPILWRAAP